MNATRRVMGIVVVTGVVVAMLVCISATLAAACLAADETGGTGSELWYGQPAESWMMEALPIGNGRMGAMFFGGVNFERLQFNEDSLWSGHRNDVEIPSGSRAWMDAMQTRLAAGDVGDEDSRAEVRGKPTNKRRSMASFGSYQPFGDIVLDFVGHAEGAPQAYRRSLDLAQGVGRISYDLDGTTYLREYFVSHPDQVMVGRLTADGDSKLAVNIKLSCPHEQAEVQVEGNDTIIFAGTMPESEMRFAATLKVRIDGGSLVTASDGTHLEVRGADSVELLLAAQTDYAMVWPELRRDVDPMVLSQQVVQKASQKSYQALKHAHVADHRELFERVSLELPSPDHRAKLPTDQRLIAYNRSLRGGQDQGGDPGFEALVFQMGRYLMIASSREGGMPANLQGIWNEMKKPAWNSDYHTDINIQMNYWVNGPTALPESFEPFVRYLDLHRSAGKEVAHKWFDADGFFVHIYTNPWAYSGLRWLWTGAGGWLCQNLYDHYLFTGDKDYLRERAYPVMKEASAFYEDVLREYYKGGLVVTPSLSPEVSFKHPEHGNLRHSAGAAIDQQIVYELFGHTADAARILGVDEELARRLLDLRGKLSPPVKIGANGAVQEWIEDWPPVDKRHRHLSHLYALFPGNQIDPLVTPGWAEAAKKALDIRTSGNSTGWGYAWWITLRARLFDGDRAHSALSKLLVRSRETRTNYNAGGIYDNLLSTHSPFQIEGNFGFTAGVAEMLVQSHRGNWKEGYEIHLLPALPEAWPEGKVTGLRARGGFVVDLEWKGGQITEAVVHSLLGRPCTVRYAEYVAELEIAKGEKRKWIGD